MSNKTSGAQVANASLNAAKNSQAILQKLNILTEQLGQLMPRYLYSQVTMLETNTNTNKGYLKIVTENVINSFGALLAINGNLREIVNILKNKSSDDKDVLQTLKNQQSVMSDMVDQQKNVVSTAVGKLGLPEATIKKLGTTIEKAQTNSLKATQKVAAKQNKSANFQNQLTSKKQAAIIIKENKTAAKRGGKKFSFSMKDFMKGLAKILGEIFNPVKMVLTFISKFLPHVLIFGAMLYGAWQALGEELQEKFKSVAEKILTVAGAIFLGWKLIPLIIKGMAMAFQGIRIIHQFQEHNARMAMIGKETVLTNVEHTAEMNKTFFGMLLEKIGFVFKKAVSVIEMVLNGIVFAIRCAVAVAGYLLIAALVIVLVGLIVLILKALWDMFGDTVIKFFKMIGDMASVILGKVVDFVKIVVDGVVGIVKWFFSKLFGFGEEPKKKNENSQDSTTTIKNGVTPTMYFQGVSQIVEPLKILNEQMTKLIKIEQAALGVALVSSLGSVFGPFGNNSTRNTSMAQKNNYTTNVSDSTETQIVVVAEAIKALDDSSAAVVKKLDDVNENIKTIIHNQIAASVGNTLHRPAR